MGVNIYLCMCVSVNRFSGIYFDVLSWKLLLLSPVAVYLFIKLIIGELVAFDANVCTERETESARHRKKPCESHKVKVKEC